MGVEEAKTLEEAPGIAHGSVRMLGMLGLALTALGCPVFRGLVGGEKKRGLNHTQGQFHSLYDHIHGDGINLVWF